MLVNTDRNNLLNEFFTEGENQSVKSGSYAKYGYGFIILGLLTAYLSWAGYIGHFILLGSAFILTGLVLIRNKLNDLFSFGDSEMLDAEKIISMFSEDVEKSVSERAFQLFGFDNDKIKRNTNFKIYFPVDENLPGIDNEKILRKQLDAETYMFSLWQIHIFSLTENYISYYSCTYDWIDNELFNELSDEFYISDIAAVKTELINREIVNKDGGEHIPSKQSKKFIISNISGDKIEFLIEESLLKLPTELETDFESLVKEIRLLIRKKRFPEKEYYTGNSVDFEIEDTRKKDDI